MIFVFMAYIHYVAIYHAYMLLVHSYCILFDNMYIFCGFVYGSQFSIF